MNVNTPTVTPEDELGADPLAEHALARCAGPPRASNRQAGGRHRSNAAVSADPVLEEVEHPDRQDEVAEERPDQAAGAGHDRQQDREVDRRPPTGVALADRRRSSQSIHSRTASGICQPRVELDSRSAWAWSCVGEARQVLR